MLFAIFLLTTGEEIGNLENPEKVERQICEQWLSDLSTREEASRLAGLLAQHRNISVRLEPRCIAPGEPLP